MADRTDNREDSICDEASQDLGGGGDLTFHLMKDAHQNDSNVNAEFLNNNSSSNSWGNTKPGLLTEINDVIVEKHEGDKMIKENSVSGEGSGGEQMITSEIQQEYENEESLITEIGENKSDDIEKRKITGQEEMNDIYKMEKIIQSGCTGGDDTKLSDERKGEEQNEDDLKDPRKFDRQQRSKVYNKAYILQQEGKQDEALKYYLAAITGLTEDNSFYELPKCLHEVSNIYFEKNEFEKAVHFIQAEKMYYETALIDIVNLQKQLAEKRKKKKPDEATSTRTTLEDAEETCNDPKVLEAKDTNPEITKAREFENLARLCLSEGKPQLALEYCGKATKTYRSQLGDDHPVTLGSLDLFALIYADVGKKLYEDAIKKFGVDDENEDGSGIKQNPQQQSSSEQNDSGSSTGIRKRNILGKGTPSKINQRTTEQRHVRFEEYEPSPPIQDDWVTTILLMILFLLITILCALIFSYFYCRNNNQSSMCAEFKGDLTYWYMKMRHTFKYYTSSGRR